MSPLPQLAYMLDTDTVSFAMRGKGGVKDHLRTHRPSELCISTLTLAELRHGADGKGSRRLHAAIDLFASAVLVAPFDALAAAWFGKVYTALTRQGTRIGDFDTLIASHALSLDLTLVTNNAKDFGRVAGLRMENWL